MTFNTSTTKLEETSTAFSDKNLAFCLLIPSFILFPDIPLWAFSSSLIFWLYRIILDYSGWKKPSRWITGIFSLIFMLATYLQYKTLIGRDASCTYLVILLSLKILEYKNPKENGFLILIGFYLVSAKFLFETDLLWFSIGFPVMILFIYFLLPFEYRAKYPKQASVFVLRSLFLSLPLGLFLFFYFPRFSSQSFFEPKNNPIAHNVGFNDHINPGSVSQLAQNDELLLRAEFINVQPQVNALYWRGATLTKQNGMQWERNESDEEPWVITPPLSIETPSEKSYARITLEPTYKKWIFALDQTQTMFSDQFIISKSPLGHFTVNYPIETRTTYTLQFSQILTRQRQEKDHLIPIQEKPTLALQTFLKELKSGTHRPEDIVGKFSEYLIKQKFEYTLMPGDQGQLTLSDFLFKTKKGFCEHFASAMAITLNYLKVPARVIAGYHGGEYNPVGKFWTVRQRDAHAWIEYIDSQNQWRRFDPTAVIAPMRLTYGAKDYAQYLQGVWATKEDLEYRIQSSPLWTRLQFFVENVNYRWNFMFVNFDLEKQKEILQQLDISWPLAILFGLFSTLVISLSLSWLLRNHQKLSRSKRILNSINSTLRKYNLEKEPTEGPIAWKMRAIENLPHRKNELNILIDCYIKEAFSGNKSRHNLKRAKQILSSF